MHLLTDQIETWSNVSMQKYRWRASRNLGRFKSGEVSHSSSHEWVSCLFWRCPSHRVESVAADRNGTEYRAGAVTELQSCETSEFWNCGGDFNYRFLSKIVEEKLCFEHNTYYEVSWLNSVMHHQTIISATIITTHSQRILTHWSRVSNMSPSKVHGRLHLYETK